MRQPFYTKNIVGGDTYSIDDARARLHNFIRLILRRRTPENDDEEKDKDVPAAFPIICPADRIFVSGSPSTFLYLDRLRDCLAGMGGICLSGRPDLRP